MHNLEPIRMVINRRDRDPYSMNMGLKHWYFYNYLVNYVTVNTNLREILYGARVCKRLRSPGIDCEESNAGLCSQASRYD
jgi:hypothetical protein